MSGIKNMVRRNGGSHRAVANYGTLAALALAMFSGVLGGPPAALGEPTEDEASPVVERTNSPDRVTKLDRVQSVSDDNTAGLCNLIDPCGDPDCSNATKCSAGCFGNPTCAPQCGGNACNVGCSLGICGARCPQECNLATCPQNNCSTRCGDPTCKPACGGSPCNGGCPDRCHPVLCPANALCLFTCGGNSCNVGCDPCEAGCPERCNPAVCATNALCLSSCGGSECNVGCSLAVCGSGCPQECDPILCPQNIPDCNWGLLNTVSSQVDTANAAAQAATDRATEALDNTFEMVGNMQDGLQNLTGEMRARIQDAVEALQQAVSDELAGAADFTNGPNSCSPQCEALRNDLVALLTGIQDMSNVLLAMEGIKGQADFSSEIDFIESLSGKALYPLYRVLQTLPVLEEGFLASMSQMTGDLAEVAPYIEDAVVAGGAAVDACRLLAENDKLVERVITAVRNINKVGKGLKMAGSVLNAVGKSKIAAWGDGWGFAGIRYTGGLLERFGGRLESVDKRLEPIAEKVEKKLKYCVLKTNQEDTIEAIGADHEQFMTTDQAILDVLMGLQAAHGNVADLNGDGTVNLVDYSLFFHSAFGSTGPPPP